MFKMTLEKTDLVKIPIPIISEIVDEGTFVIDKDGLSLLSPDRTMVAVVDFRLPASSFTEFIADGRHEVGINTSALVNVLKRLKGSDKLVMESGDNKLIMTILGKGKRRFELSLLDIKSEKPPIDQLSFPGKVSLSSDVLEEGISDAEIVSDSVVFHATPGAFRIKAGGETSSAELEVKSGEECLHTLDVKENMKARYPIEYLKKMIKAAKLSDKAEIEFGNDYPMRLRFIGENVNMSFVLAPRVEE